MRKTDAGFRARPVEILIIPRLKAPKFLTILLMLLVVLGGCDTISSSMNDVARRIGGLGTGFRDLFESKKNKTTLKQKSDQPESERVAQDAALQNTLFDNNGPTTAETTTAETIPDVGTLTFTQVEAGVRTLMQQALIRTVRKLDRIKGFVNHKKYQIPFPAEFIIVRDGLLESGYPQGSGFPSDPTELELSINQAAQFALRHLYPLILGHINTLVIERPRQIVLGASDAATRYLEAKKITNLLIEARPIFEESLQKTGTIRRIKAIREEFGYRFPNQPNPNNEDFIQHLVQNTIGVLFIEMGQWEAYLRITPDARTSSDLVMLFGK